MAEQIILDPTELATGRSQLDITPWIDAEGIDWGESSVDAFMAEAALGETPVDYRTPNREISGGLKFHKSIGGTSAVAARAAISTKISQLQREGGWGKRITASGGTVFFDITNASFRATSVSGIDSQMGRDITAAFSLSAVPDFYESETTDADNTTTTQRELLYTTALTGQGDQPMRCRIVVDNDGSTDWRGLIWGFRSKNYPGSTAATRNTGSASMVYEAESLGTLDTAAKAALSGASGGTVVTHGTLSTSWTPVLSGRIGGTTYPTHTGTYQMYARLYSTSGTTVRARTVWDVGDLVNPTENDAWRLPGASNFYIADLGEVRLDNSGLGTYRWDWQIQGAGDAGAENLSVDKVWLANKDEGMGVLSAPLAAPLGLSAYSARSEFTTESGAITGDALAVGGNWTVVTNSDTDDFSISSATAQRTATSDTGTGTSIFAGRGVSAGTATYTATAVQVDYKASAFPSALSQAVFARLVDSSNWLAARVVHQSTSHTILLGKAVSSTPVVLGGSGELTHNADAWYTIRLIVYSTGQCSAWWGVQGGALSLVASGYDASLATGGTLASGKAGIADWNSTATASTRSYDNFALWVPSADAVTFASQSVQLTTDGIYREDSGGTAYGPVSSVVGDLPRFPVPQQSGGTVEALLVPSTGDLDQIPDTLGTASISAQNVRRPSWLFVDDS